MLRKEFVVSLVDVLIVLSISPAIGSVVKTEENNLTTYGMTNIISGNGILCGYVTDVQTNLPIENAQIDIERYFNYWILVSHLKFVSLRQMDFHIY